MRTARGAGGIGTISEVFTMWKRLLVVALLVAAVLPLPVRDVVAAPVDGAAGCDTSDTDQKVLNVYVRRAGAVNRYDTYVGDIRARANEIDAEVETASGPRWSQKVDWHRTNGQITVCSATFTDDNGDGITKNEIIDDLRAQGFNRGARVSTDSYERIYLLLIDVNGYPRLDNLGTGTKGYPSNTETGTRSTTYHEFVHALGNVTRSGNAASRYSVDRNGTVVDTLTDPYSSFFHTHEWGDILDAWQAPGAGEPRSVKFCEHGTLADSVIDAPGVRDMDCMKNEYYSADEAKGYNPDWRGINENVARSGFLTQITPESTYPKCAGSNIYAAAGPDEWGHDYGATVNVSSSSYGLLWQGGDGHDTAYGATSGDWICGGNGRDYIDGGTGWDVLSGGPGVDTIYGREGDDEIYDGWGADQIFGGAGNDVLYQCADGGTYTDPNASGNDNINGIETVKAGSAAYCYGNNQ
ncbi:MAG: calcium-binding protein [Actinomycetota bacterium]